MGSIFRAKPIQRVTCGENFPGFCFVARTLEPHLLSGNVCHMHMHMQCVRTETHGGGGFAMQDNA